MVVYPSTGFESLECCSRMIHGDAQDRSQLDRPSIEGNALVSNSFTEHQSAPREIAYRIEASYNAQKPRVTGLVNE